MSSEESRFFKILFVSFIKKKIMKNFSITIISITAIISSLIIGSSISNIKLPIKQISVTGSAQKIIQSDAVKWTLKLSRQVELGALKDGYAQMSSDLKKINEFLTKSKIADREINTAPITVEKQQIESTTDNGVTIKKDYYILIQTYVINSNDVAKLSDAIDKSTELIQAGIPIENLGLEYYYTKLSELKLEMLTEATKNTKERAETIADSVGAKLDGLLSADMGVFQITPVNSTEVDDWGTYDTTSYEKQITAIVRSDFRVK